MATKLRVLILEDQPTDAEIMVNELRRSGIELDWTRVETEQDFLAGLDPPPDVILADYSLPHFDAIRALYLTRKHRPDVPFIIVSGTIGEERAVAVMKEGATDYLLKDRLARLGAAVLQAIKLKQLQDEKRRTELALVRQAEEVIRVNNDLQLFGSSVEGREMRVIELKQQINELCRELGREPLYDFSDSFQKKGEGATLEHERS